MLIRCTTSLSEEDEAVLVPVIVALVASAFDAAALSYSIDADIANHQTCRCVRAPERGADRSALPERRSLAIEVRNFDS